MPIHEEGNEPLAEKSNIHNVPAGEAETSENGKSLIVIAVCSVLCMFFMRIGLLSLFYLAPLGYAVLVTNRLRLTFFTAALTVIGFLFISSLLQGGYSAYLWLEIFYFLLLFFMFLWITGGKKTRTAYRFVIASVLCSVIFLIYLFTPGSALNIVIEIIVEDFHSILSSTNTTDTALLQFAQPESLAQTITNFLLRGGSIVSLMMMFFINRQFAVTSVWIIKKRRVDKGLSSFFAPENTIWFLSISLAVIILSSVFNFTILEIIAWNIFTLCCIIFFVQGIGIAKNFLSKRTQRFRMVINILLVLAIFSPLSIVIVLALLILGIIEIWLPIRLGIRKGQASTPEQ